MKKLVTASDNGKRTRITSDPGHALILIYMVCIVVLLLLGSFSQVKANETPTLNLDEVQRGELLIPSGDQGRFTASSLLEQKVKIQINGIVAAVEVEQRFKNTGKDWLEAVYVFPLPSESAVQKLKMKVGERLIEGEIKEKQEARRLYEKAKGEGRKSSLLVQKRPNIFTTSVANIGPGEEVVVEFHYHQLVHFSDSIFSLRFPMVVAPRYIPGTPIPPGETVRVNIDGGGWARNSDVVPDASHITPPVSPGSEKLNPIELEVELDPGFPIKRVESLYHGMDIREGDSGLHLLTFNQHVKADRDFVLEWQAKTGYGVTGGMFAETRGGEHFRLLMVMPPEPKRESPQVPREMIFVLDTSGSMAGSSISQAKKALMLAISRLDARDEFNIIEFNNEARALFSRPQKADMRHVNRALAFVKGLQAEGGTEIGKALMLALDGKRERSRLRQVVFLTDGSVGNEEQLFGFIRKELGDSRLFTVGIGSAPNSFFMTRAAAMGRGTFTYVGKIEEVEEKMNNLFRKLENPVITGLRLDFSGDDCEVEVFPSPLPDLYAGEPLSVSVKSTGPIDRIFLTGQRGAEGWKMELQAGQKLNQKGIATLWARKKIRNQMEALHLGAEKEEVRQTIVATALEHHLISKYTSLVAVDNQVTRPMEKKAITHQQKMNLPHGWKYESVFGGRSKTATPADLYLVLGAILLLFSLVIMRRGRRIG